MWFRGGATLESGNHRNFDIISSFSFLQTCILCKIEDWNLSGWHSTERILWNCSVYTFSPCTIHFLVLFSAPPLHSFIIAFSIFFNIFFISDHRNRDALKLQQQQKIGVDFRFGNESREKKKLWFFFHIHKITHHLCVFVCVNFVWFFFFFFFWQSNQYYYFGI